MFNKKIIVLLVLVLCIPFLLFADDPWWIGQKMSQFEVNGVKNVDEVEIDNILYEYRGVQFTDTTFNELKTKLENISGVEFIIATAENVPETNALKIVIEVNELPIVGDILIQGNSKVKETEILDSLNVFSEGSFIDIYRNATINEGKKDIEDLYSTKGFENEVINIDWNLDEEKNAVNFTIDINEGIQTRVLEITFEGNENLSSSDLRKQCSTKVRSLFNFGYLDSEKIKADVVAISDYYKKNGYIDVIVSEPRVEEILDSTSDKYREVRLVFPVSEGLQWRFGSITVTGNEIITDEEIQSKITMQKGSIADVSKIQQQLSDIADLYWNEGYINNQMDVKDSRDDTTMEVSYNIQIVEKEQAYVQDVVIRGMTKTQPYVFERELALNKGDVFSKAKLITSYQNLYNTGLLTDLKYNIRYGDSDGKVIIDFDVTEGNQVEIQFGATFGGNLDGFPISGFLQLKNKNLGGTGRDLSVGANVSPDKQTFSVSFGDDWVKDKRWSNSISLDFSHSKVDNVLQKGIGSDYYDGRDTANVTYPLGYNSNASYIAADKQVPDSQYLMSYDMYKFGIGYNTGYTFIYDVGRLSLSTGLSFSINKAIYDTSSFIPYEELISKYGEKWQFSNKLNLSLQWDGRDLIENTTKGYVLGQSFTYAGGIFGGLSNYIKSTTNAAGYLKLASFGKENPKNLMLSLSTSVNFMLPQLYKGDQGIAFYNPKMGATKYEMLYIDGLTNARGFEAVADQSFLWDNSVEISYPIAENVINAETFVSGTAISSELSEISTNGVNWYFSGGAGVKLKIPGFPIGLYLVKNATYSKTDGFNWVQGSLFGDLGMKMVLAISTSLI